MSCDNLCTAAKCEELENRLSALEQALELLQASFTAHTQQDIPEAHNYNPPPFDFEPYINIIVNRILIEIKPTLQIIIDDLNLHIGSDYTIVHNYKNHKSNLKIDGSFAGEILYLTVADGESQDTTTISIPLPKIPVFEPFVEVNADIYDGTLAINVVVNDANDTATVDLPSGEQHQKSRLNLDGIYQNEVLTLTVADGESQDTASITITMNCDNLEQNIKDCCEQLTNLISNSFNNLDNQLANLENAINTEIKQVYDEVTIDISGTADSYYTCGFEFKDGEFVPGYAKSGSSERTYTGKGLKGIDASLEIVNSNLRRMFDSICKSVQPPHTLYLEDLYQFCDDSGIQREDYPEGSDGDEDYENAIKTYLDSLLSETKYANLINAANENVLLHAPQYWITNVLTDFSLIQSKINNSKLCSLDQPTDVVSIVASPKYVTNVEGKVLILHFVTEDNYPKRSRGSNYRQIQIPGAKTEYDWELDFKDLRWIQGNQYAELVLNEYRATVSGWFANENAANAFFDDVLKKLTIGTEKNRKCPKHKYSRTDIQIQITRPYRAFIESINLEGQAICHVKYVPPIEPK